MRLKVPYIGVLVPLFLAASACASAQGVEEVLPLDTALFELLVVELVRDSANGELVIDPRPLRKHPGAGDYYLGYLIPGYLETDSIIKSTGGNAEQWDELIGPRRQILSRYSIRAAEHFAEVNCPSPGIVSRATSAERAQLECPTETIRVAWIAVPRKGVHSNRGDLNYTDLEVYSIRVISRHLSADGGVETHSDYIFEHLGEDWRFLERRMWLVLD